MEKLTQLMDELNDTMSDIIQDVYDGNQSALEVKAVKKMFLDKFKSFADVIDEAAQSEAENYEQSFDLFGFRFEKRKGSKRFDFSNIEEIQDLKAMIKEREQFYKTAFASYEKGINQVSEDGEILEMPKVTYGKDVLVIKNL